MSVVSPLLPEPADAHSAFLAMVKRMRSTGSKSRTTSALRAESQKPIIRATPYPSHQTLKKRSKQKSCDRTGRAGLVRKRACTPSTATDSSVPNTPEHSAGLPLPTSSFSYAARDTDWPASLYSGFSCEPVDIDAIFTFSDPTSFSTLGKKDAEYLELPLTQELELDSKQDALVDEMFAKYIDWEGGQVC